MTYTKYSVKLECVFSFLLFLFLLNIINPYIGLYNIPRLGESY